MSIETEREALKPCPFCGGEAIYGFNFNAEWVECTDCGVDVVCDTFDEAAAAWNRRASFPSGVERVEPVANLTLPAGQTEPVAWRREWDGDVSDEGQWLLTDDPADLEDGHEWQPLFTAAPTKEQIERSVKWMRECFAHPPQTQPQGDAPHPANPSTTPSEPAYAGSPGYALAMRVMQSDLYRNLDPLERSECDELVRRGLASPSSTPGNSRESGDGVRATPTRSAVPDEFWNLLHEWADSRDPERIDWIEHRFGELFALAALGVDSSRGGQQ